MHPEEYAAARETAALFDLSARGKIRLVGKEAATFLHNLCTNDVKNLAPLSGCEAFFCTATAKVVAHGEIWRGTAPNERDTFWLDLPAGQAAKVYQHLDRHLISEDVTLDDQSEALAQFHVVGPTADAVLMASGIEPGEWKRGSSTVHSESVVRCVDPLGLPGRDLLVPVSQREAWQTRLVAAGARLASPEVFEVLRIEAGTPRYGLDLDENTFAPEVNRTAQAISYQKGCYLGQEPIVMARDRGVVQRALVGLLVGPEPIAPGSLLFRDGKEVGRTTSSVHSPRLGQAIALAYVRRGSQTPGIDLEVDSGGSRRPVRVAALPF